MENADEEFQVPIPIQTFLWRQTCPFIRPRLGKLHEATCVEIREACKSLEKVLVQNIQFGLSPSLTEAIRGLPRWRLIQIAFPHVMHCASNLLYNRKVSGIQTGLGAAETKLLYTLHWILLDCAEECADSDFEKGLIPESSFHYLFSISAITTFVYLFAPLCNQLKPMDFNNFRLENGFKIWPHMWGYKTPDAVCFNCPVKPKFTLNPFFIRKQKKVDYGDVFVGAGGSGQKSPSGDIPGSGGEVGSIATPPPTPELGAGSKGEFSPALLDDELERYAQQGASSSGAGNNIVPCETIPEESSSNDEEHVMIFRLGSIPESDGLREGAVFKMSVRQSSADSSKSSPAPTEKNGKDRKGSQESRATDSSPRVSIAGLKIAEAQKLSKSPKDSEMTEMYIQPWKNAKLASFMDVAVMRCLFISHWEEEGVHWGITYMAKRLEEIAAIRESQINETEHLQRPRSCSLPSSKTPLHSVFIDGHKSESKSGGSESKSHPGGGSKRRDTLVCSNLNQFSSFSACSSPVSERKVQNASRRASVTSNKPSTHGKKKITMFDFRTFVENKLLSKSERALEKIGSDKTPETQDSPEDSRTKSSMGYAEIDQKKRKQSSTMGDSYFNISSSQSNLVKGKSMPSLSNLLDDLALARATTNSNTNNKLSPPGYVGVSQLTVEPHIKPTLNMPNPIITVTEHTPLPTPSPEKRRFRKISSLESQLNLYFENLNTRDSRKSPRRAFFRRSKSDSNILYSISESHEATGTSKYITSQGEINVKIMFKALHLISTRDHIIKSTRICTAILDLFDFLYGTIEKNEEIWTIIETLTKIITTMGCSQGCGDSPKGSAAESVRSHAQSLLLKMSHKWQPQFGHFFRNFVIQQNLSKIMDFFHSLCSFCVDSSSLLSPMNQRVRDFYASYANGMENHHTNRVDCQIFKMTFKKLITRLSSMAKELRSAENMALYCEVRQFINFVYDNDGNTFRKVALSALIDSVERGVKNPVSKTSSGNGNKPMKRSHHSEDSSFYVVDETSGSQQGGEKGIISSSGGNNKRGFFKKKSSSSTCASVGDTEITEKESPSGTLSGGKKHAVLTPKSSEIDLIAKRNASLPQQSFKKESRLVSWLTKSPGVGGDKNFEYYDIDDGGNLASDNMKLDSGTKRTMRQATIVQKAKRRVEEKLKKIKIKKEIPTEDYTAYPTGVSRRTSVENTTEQMSNDGIESFRIKERRIVNKKAIRDGLIRFGFLLEITHPGTLPDSQLMGAILDLPKTVVVARASILLECAFLVHACNRGHWPLWMKFPLFRPSTAGLTAKPLSSKIKSLGLQRAAGRMFHQWGEAINARLEEFIKSNAVKLAELDFSDETKQRDYASRDDEEDFLDEASIADEMECPIALQILSCMLLYEITSFLRETYQTLPKINIKGGTDSKSQGQNRRWSYGLSSMGQSQASHSNQSIADPNAPPVGGERKISFVLQDNESTGSGDKPQAELAEQKDVVTDEKKFKKARPLLLRRGTPAQQGSVAGSSFRRRSIKLQSKGSSKKEDDSFKRTDSMTSSKRKVSSISDETEQNSGQNSGDESPGILSNEEQAAVAAEDESLCMPWINTMIQYLSALHFGCTHQSFCHPLCPRRLSRTLTRLLKAVRKIYGEEFGLPKTGMAYQKRTTSYSLVHNVKEPMKKREKFEEPPLLKYIKHQVQGAMHSMFSILIKSGSIMAENQYLSLIPILWDLLIEPDVQVSTCSACLMILAAVKTPEPVKAIMARDFLSENSSIRLNALLRFQILWRCRHQVIPRMEDNSNFKFPPPGIEFTLPSPRIGVECIPVVDPPWMPGCKAKVEEVALNQETQVSRRYLVTATSSRKTQQAEVVKMALQAEEDKKRVERQQFLITSVPITAQASYEPSLHHAVDEDGEEEGQNQTQQGPGINLAGDKSNLPQGINLTQGSEGISVSTGVAASKSTHLRVLSVFPSSLCTAGIYVIQLLDDPAVTPDGNSIYETAYQVLWKCLVEDSSLFLRHIFEKLTRGKHEMMFKILRHLIMFVPRLPQQAAFSLYNHIIGFIMLHTRQSQDASLEMIGSALSLLWMVVHSVQGIMFKDLKQILRKEQADASILLTANVPAAKKIIVHGPMGPDSGGIPSQFPIQEDTQFLQILREAHDFFSIDEEQHREYFLVDHKTHQIHNPNSYVRDFYFFSRSHHPQLSLVHMSPEHAYNGLQRQAFILKFLEIGKVTLTWAILKNVDQVMQRVVFLHEELMKLPSFPRKALESDLDITKAGIMGRELLGLNVIHKFMWIKLICRMFEAMAGNFAYSGDIHLFINVLSGALMVHSEDATIMRYTIGSFINAAQEFKNIFSTNGYLLVMPPLLLIYSNHQSNPLVTGAIEFACKEFYLLNRKPFILQMFGALAALLDTDETSQFGDPKKIPSKCLFRLLLSLETPTPDPLKITELIQGSLPLRPLDFCYHDDSDEITVLDCIAMCVCACAYASDSLRGQQMLTILEAVVPPYLGHIQVNKTEGKSERDIINHIAVAMKTLINNCEPLSKNYTGPNISVSSDLRGSSQRNYTTTKGGLTPGYEFADDDSHSKYMSDHSKNKSFYDREVQDSETIREEFRRPRDTLLCLVSDFYSKSSQRLQELSKKGGAEAKPVELLDMMAHERLSEVAMSLLKVSPYDPSTMASRGLQRYMNEVFPFGEWSHEAARPALLAFLRRLEKTFAKICKKPAIRRHTDWEAASGLLKGVYQSLWRHSYICHMQHLKSLISTCQTLLMGDGQVSELGLSNAGAAIMGRLPPAHFCSTVVRLLALQVRALGENYSLEQACGLSPGTAHPQDKYDIILMNLLLPMCLRVGSGRKDVPKMRKSDIIFILNVILNNIASPGSRPKIISETNNSSVFGLGGTGTQRSGSINERKFRTSTFQICFLGLKILCVCFDTELNTEWARTIRIIEDLVYKGEGGEAVWDFLEFVITIRTSIYPMFRSLIAQKMSKPPSNDQERHFIFVLREKMRSISLGKSKGSLLLELAHEMKSLKEELEQRKEETLMSKKTLGPEVNESRRARPSLSELFPGIAARFAGSPAGEDGSGKSGFSRGINRESSVRLKQSTGERIADRFLRRVSIAGDVAPFSIPENSILKKGEEFGERSTEGHSGQGQSTEEEPKSHRLQRSKFQSRKTFRFRKSRKGLEFSSIDMEEKSESPTSPMSPSGREESSLKSPSRIEEEEKSYDSIQSSNKESSKGKTSLKIRLKKRKKSTSPSGAGSSGQNQNGGDLDSQNSFSRTSSTCGYRESFGSVERYSLQMLERLEVQPPDIETKKERSSSRKKSTGGGDDNNDTSI